jgi:hypothetical protein
LRHCGVARLFFERFVFFAGPVDLDHVQRRDARLRVEAMSMFASMMLRLPVSDEVSPSQVSVSSPLATARASGTIGDAHVIDVDGDAAFGGH